MAKELFWGPLGCLLIVPALLVSGWASATLLAAGLGSSTNWELGSQVPTYLLSSIIAGCGLLAGIASLQVAQSRCGIIAVAIHGPLLALGTVALIAVSLKGYVK